MSEHKVEGDAEYDNRAGAPAQRPTPAPCAFGRDHVEDGPEIEDGDTPQAKAGEVRQASGRIEHKCHRNRHHEHDEPAEIQPECANSHTLRSSFFVTSVSP